MDAVDSVGIPRTDDWHLGKTVEEPGLRPPNKASKFFHQGGISEIVRRSMDGNTPSENDIVRLFYARGQDISVICEAADDLRRQFIGSDVTYVVNRNINYTNVCYFQCGFCAFSKGKTGDNLRGKPYQLEIQEIQRRVQEAWARGATEVCMQGGIHPQYTGENYIEFCHAVRSVAPDMHIHAFSPLEIWQGASTLDMSIGSFLERLVEAGLRSLPGTAAEILDDRVRRVLCPDKISTAQWFDVMKTAHELGLRSTSTIMFGHVDGPQHWAKHLLRILRLQEKTGGFTEFVPLPFVHMEAPIYLKGRARAGPTYRECVLMHAVSRLVFHAKLPNIQTSWVKMGPKGAAECLRAGANDLGGTLMNETITRSAGAAHGQEMLPERLEKIICDMGRVPRQRNTLYGGPAEEQRMASFATAALRAIEISPIHKRER
jgi:FO synthase